MAAEPTRSFEKWEANFNGIDIHRNAGVKLPFLKR
jgi:hypothetical protein